MACGTSDTHGIPANDPRTRQSGRVLVPGVTLGVLGHDAMVHCADGGVEDEYAELLQEQCRRAGIHASPWPYPEAITPSSAHW